VLLARAHWRAQWLGLGSGWSSNCSGLKMEFEYPVWISQVFLFVRWGKIRAMYFSRRKLKWRRTMRKVSFIGFSKKFQIPLAENKPSFSFKVSTLYS
jgi:hypothetical protein